MKKKTIKNKFRPNWKKIAERPEMVDLKKRLALEGWELTFPKPRR